MQDAVDRPEQRGPGLVVEDDDDAGGGQRRAAEELSVNAPGKVEPHQTQQERNKRVRGKDRSDQMKRHKVVNCQD